MSGLWSSILIDGTLGSNSRGVPGTRGGPRWEGWVHRPHVLVGCHVALPSARFENWTARAAIGQADLGIGPRRVPHLRPVFQKSPIVIWPAGFLLRHRLVRVSSYSSSQAAACPAFSGGACSLPRARCLNLGSWGKCGCSRCAPIATAPVRLALRTILVCVALAVV